MEYFTEIKTIKKFVIDKIKEDAQELRDIALDILKLKVDDPRAYVKEWIEALKSYLDTWNITDKELEQEIAKLDTTYGTSAYLQNIADMQEDEIKEQIAEDIDFIQDVADEIKKEEDIGYFPEAICIVIKAWLGIEEEEEKE